MTHSGQKNHPVPTSNVQDGVLTITVERELYPLDVLFSASYVFLDRAFIFFDGNPRGEIVITFEPKDELKDDGLRMMAGDFLNELVAVRVRQSIADRNKTIREYIVSGVLGAAVGEHGTDFGGGLGSSVSLEDLGVPLEDVPEDQLKKTPIEG